MIFVTNPMDYLRGDMAMREPVPRLLTRVLADEEHAGRLVVDLAAYLDFVDQMDSELDELVGRWIHLAAPRALKRTKGKLQS